MQVSEDRFFDINPDTMVNIFRKNKDAQAAGVASVEARTPVLAWLIVPGDRLKRHFSSVSSHHSAY